MIRSNVSQFQPLGLLFLSTWFSGPTCATPTTTNKRTTKQNSGDLFVWEFAGRSLTLLERPRLDILRWAGLPINLGDAPPADSGGSEHCDLAKPEFSRCVKRGTRCLGYETNRHFLYPGVDASGTSKRPVTQLLGQLKPLALPAPLNLGTEARTQLFSTFLNTFFASDTDLDDLNARDDSWYFLMARFPSLAGESALLDRSIMALVCAFLGKQANDLPLMNDGGELYSEALRVMAWILRQKLPPTPHLFYATIVFHTYEVLLQHCLDLAERLRTCSPDGLSENCSSETRPSAPWERTMLRPANSQPLPWSEDDLADPPLYQFTSLATAKTHLLFWIVALTIRRRIYHTVTLCQEGKEPTPGAVMLTLLRAPAREIRRTVAYHLQPRNLMSSAHVLLFAVAVVSKCYLDRCDEAGFAWCQNIYRILQSRGWEVAGRLGDADRELWACTHLATEEDVEFSSPTHAELYRRVVHTIPGNCSEDNDHENQEDWLDYPFRYASVWYHSAYVFLLP
ncbi:hypothetical protein BO82DRAFT_394922 [Aspergillus uvarum CBS 121591]|uniref:Transcription factor domain-containing protein n=1 Tax=Aspergillus uvarum CBS 121591 TaxID=1448315 RepID=A0A319C1K1_9EURO|nr:hypothetical protein BO82DRAFT_394922 [Aspergillus uvarum CBS 121591]PYH78077.1 hypothetical protein BO82DRAFT_394922 [Aspergillus uvarum CBS 121591]